MVRPLMTDTVFLAQKALPADAGDITVADDLLDTLKRTRTAASAWPPI